MPQLSGMGWKWEPRSTRRRRKRQEFKSLAAEASRLAHQGDQISLNQARDLAIRIRDQDKADPFKHLKRIGALVKADLDKAPTPPPATGLTERRKKASLELPDFGDSIYEGTKAKRPEAQVDPTGRRISKQSPGGFLKEIGAKLIESGRPLVGATSAALQGDNPIGGAFRESGDVFESTRRGQRDPKRLPAYRALDVPGINRLPDKGIEAGPLNITPKTFAGLALETVADPTSYIDVPLGIGAARSALRGRRAGAGAIEESIERGAQLSRPRPFMERVGENLSPSLSGATAEKLPPTHPSSATQRLFQIKEPGTGLTKTDRALNAFKETLGMGTLEDEVATPIMRERQRVQRITESQAARLGALSDETARVFPTDKQGRLSALPGQPTLQDVAAKLPMYERYLSMEQRQAMNRLRAETEPFADALAELGVDVRSRADIVDGGFYLPRGNAIEEGMDLPRKVRSGRGGAGGKKGFEKGAVFDSMAEGIDAGYEYAPFREAMQSYAQDAGTRAADQWTAEAFKATGLGESMADRLNPGLRSQVQTLRAKIASKRQTLIRQNARKATVERGARQAGRIAEQGAELADNAQLRVDASTEEAITAAQREARILQREARKQAARAERAGNFAEAERIRREVTGTEYDRLRTELDDISGEWKRAQEKARQTPRDQGSIGFQQLSGTSFPDSVANAANKYLNAEKPAAGRGTGVVIGVQAMNAFLRSLRATADISAMGIQGLLGAVTHPREYKRALVASLKSLGDEQVLGAYINQFDEKARAAGKPTSRDWAASTARIGGSATEFEIGQGLGPKVGRAIRNAPVIKQTNRSFGTFGDVLRLEVDDALYDAAKASNKQITPELMEEIARAGNLITGYSETRLGGEVGELALFAPRFFASQMELVGRAMTLDPSAAGDEARAALLRLVGVGTLATVAANEARGFETDFNPDSGNFMRIRDVFGQDISLFGPWDSLVRGMAATAGGDETYFLRTKASPTVSVAWDVLSGKTFMGENASLTDPEYLIRSFLPFSIADIGRESPLSTAINTTGVKATPLSPTDQLDQLSRDRFNGKGWRETTLEERGTLLRENPELAQKLSEGRQGKYGEYEEAKAGANEQRKAVNDALLNGSLTREQWRDRMDEINTRLQGARDQIFGGDQEPPSEDEQKRDPALKYLAIRREFTDPLTKTVDEDAFQEALSGRMTESQVKAAFRGFGADDEPLQRLRSKIADEYYDIPRYRGYTAEEGEEIDRLWEHVLAKTGNTDSEVRRIRAVRDLNVSDPKVRRALLKRASGDSLQTDPRRKRYAERNPAARPLLGLGRGVATEEERQAIEQALAQVR